MLKNTILLFCFSIIAGDALTQTFFGAGNLPVPPGAPTQTIGVTQSQCFVSGVGVLGGCVTIDNVQIDLLHTFVGDIGILLIGPGGQVLELSTSNGGGGDNYTNTVFTDNTGPFITSGAPPYAGTFRPEGRVTNLNNPYSNGPALGTYTFASTYNGTNADGVWTLYINDYVIIDVGLLNSWSITFNTGGNLVANAGPDKTICDSGNTSLTASGGATYEWSTGETTPTINVSPTTTTTYTVTVTSPGCNSDTDEVVVNVRNLPTVSLSVSNNDICAGSCPTVTVNFTGQAPYALTWQASVNGTPVNQATQIFATNSSTFTTCVPANAPPGSFMIAATALTDAFCTCQ